MCVHVLSYMTGAEIDSKKSEFQLYLGARIVTAPSGAEIHSRRGVENKPKFLEWIFVFFEKFHAHILDLKINSYLDFGY